jgi:hypothetical protein
MGLVVTGFKLSLRSSSKQASKQASSLVALQRGLKCKILFDSSTPHHSSTSDDISQPKRFNCGAKRNPVPCFGSQITSKNFPFLRGLDTKHRNGVTSSQTTVFCKIHFKQIFAVLVRFDFQVHPFHHHPFC